MEKGEFSKSWKDAPKLMFFDLQKKTETWNGYFMTSYIWKISSWYQITCESYSLSDLNFTVCELPFSAANTLPEKWAGSLLQCTGLAEGAAANTKLLEWAFLSASPPASNNSGLQPQKESKDGTASRVRPTPRPVEVAGAVGELRAVASFAKELFHPLLFPRGVFLFCGTPRCEYNI